MILKVSNNNRLAALLAAGVRLCWLQQTLPDQLAFLLLLCTHAALAGNQHAPTPFLKTDDGDDDDMAVEEVGKGPTEQSAADPAKAQGQSKSVRMADDGG